MKDPIQRALRETQADLEQVSSHLALIRESIEHGENSPTRAELARRLSVSLVSTLGFERVAIVLPGEDGRLENVATYGQTERFGGPREPRRAWATRLAKEVLDEGTLVRWGGEGVGASRRRPRDLEEDVIGLPLETGGEILGAILCTEIAARPWTLARHRALDLVGQSVGQVVALQRSRCEVEDARQTLELQLFAAHTKLATQDERIDSLASSLDVADRVKDTFLGLLSHELRTPLAAMLGYSSLLRERDVGPLNDDQDDFVDRIETNGRRLGYLLDDLLFLTEAESSRIRPTKTELELEPLVDTVRRALPPPVEGSSPELVVSVAPGAERLHGDPALLRRLLFHLLDDVWRTAAGGTVRLEAAPDERDNVHMRVAVTDRGGDSITPATEERDEPALRIGQSLIRLCVSLLDGRCRLLPRGEPGTRAEVWIPAASSPPKAGLVARRKAAGKARTKAKSTKPRRATKRSGG